MSNHTLPRLAGALFSGLLVLAALVAPMAALAADDGAAPPDAQPTDAQPTDAQPTEVLDDGFDGEVVYDPYFISPEPDATPEVAPVGEILRSTDRPQVTPPATDTISVPSGVHGGSGVPLLLVVLAAFSITVLALGRAPAVRRR